jgi:large subunit ribosomal protein L23
MSIKGFVITEKSTELAEEGKYTFWVDSNDSKSKIKDEIEKRFDVNVIKVNIIRKRGRRVRLGRSTGKKKDRKKAIISLKKGQKINEFEVAE